jgi:hypothetical protein
MFLEALLRLLLFLLSIVEKLLGIILAHLLLLLLLFLLLIFVLIILVFIVLILLLFILVILILFILLVLLVLILLALLLPHAEREVIARLIVRRVVSQALLISFDGIREELMLLAHHSDVVPHHRLTELGRLTLSRILKLRHGSTVLLLHQQRATEIIKRLRVGRILAQRLPVLYLSLGIVLLAVQAVTISDKLPVALCMNIKHSHHAHGQQEQASFEYNVPCYIYCTSHITSFS